MEIKSALRELGQELNATYENDKSAITHRSEIQSAGLGSEICRVDVEKKKLLKPAEIAQKSVPRYSDRYEQLEETPTTNRLEKIAEFNEEKAGQESPGHLLPASLSSEKVPNIDMLDSMKKFDLEEVMTPSRHDDCSLQSQTSSVNHTLRDLQKKEKLYQTGKAYLEKKIYEYESRLNGMKTKKE